MRTGSPSLFPSASPCEGDLFSTFAIVLVVVVLFVSNWDNSYYSIQTAVGKLSQFIDCLVLPWLTCVIKYSNRGGSIGILNSLYPQDKHTCVSIKNKIRKKKGRKRGEGPLMNARRNANLGTKNPWNGSCYWRAHTIWYKRFLSGQEHLKFNFTGFL